MKTIVISSGKGGVGKTSMAVNLSIIMAHEHAMDVALIDADIGTANVNLLLGAAPHRTIKDIQKGRSPSSVGAKIYGITLYAGDAGREPDGGYNIAGIVNAVKSTGPDVVILDTHPGVTKSSIEAIRTGDHIVVVSSPEITSVTDTYQLIKRIGCNKQKISILMNEANPKMGYAKAGIIAGVARTHLKRDIEYVGNIRYSRIVREAVAEQTPFYVTQPNSSVVRDLSAVCKKILRSEEESI